MNVLVMGGMGQVGSALCNKLRSNNCIPYVLDKKGEFIPSESIPYEFIHVTIPFTDYFFEAVRRAIRKYSPKHVVIHSSVPVGTTRRISPKAAHSPVRGQHNSLEDGLMQFVKYVGCEDRETRDAVVKHLQAAGMRVQAWRKPEDTELMKLLCLTRYLADLAMYEMAFTLCRKFKVTPFRFLQWTETYNEGYKGTRWVRPELAFPMGQVGGHCVMPVSKMLADQTHFKWLQKNIDLFGSRARKDLHFANL